MLASRIPQWVLPVVLGVVVAIASADLVLMRRHPVSPKPRAIPDQIGLHVDTEDDGLRVQWDRHSRPVREGDRAILYIQDGTRQRKVDLAGRQLSGASVRYWPESELVTLRMEVYRGTRSSTESAAIGMPEGRNRRPRQRLARVKVEMRPSPFERVAPEIIVTQTRPEPVPILETAARAVPELEPPDEGRFNRILSKIPLLRRLKNHPSTDETEPR